MYRCSFSVLQMADEDADGGVDDEDEEEDEAAKAAAAAAAAATAALPVNTTAVGTSAGVRCGQQAAGTWLQPAQWPGLEVSWPVAFEHACMHLTFCAHLSCTLFFLSGQEGRQPTQQAACH